MGRWRRGGERTSGKELFFALQFAIGTCVAVSIAGYCYLTKYTALQALTARSCACEVHPPLKSRLLTAMGDPRCAVGIFFRPLWQSTIGYPVNTDLRPACEYYLGLR